MTWYTMALVAFLSFAAIQSAVVKAVKYVLYPTNCLKVLVLSVKDCVVSNIEYYSTTIPLTDRSIAGGTHGTTTVVTP